MAKGGKKKKPKQKLTKEEKAAKKEMARLRKEEAKRQERMEHLQRELELAEKSWEKLKHQFKEMLLKMQMPTIRHDLEVLWHSYDAALDRKDYVIEKLMSELEERELLRRRCFSEHATALTNLIAMKEKRVEEAQTQYEKERDQALREHEADTLRREDKRTTTRQHFNVVTNAMHARTEDVILSMRSEYVLRLDDERDKTNDARKLLKGVLENRLDDAWRTLRRTLAEYESSTTDRRLKMLQMAQHDARSTALLERQEQRVQHLQATEESMRWKLAHDEPSEKLRGRQAEQNYFSVAYTALRYRLDKDRQHDIRQLARLTSISNHTLEVLRRLVAKGERLLSVAWGCRQLERLEERIVPAPVVDANPAPVGALAFAAQRGDRLMRRLQHKLEEEEEGEESDDLRVAKVDGVGASPCSSSSSSLGSLGSARDGGPASLMAGFWRRAARADVARADLLETLSALRWERASLRRALQCCMRQLPDSLRPRTVDARACAEACQADPDAEADAARERQGRNIDNCMEVKHPENPRTIVEASHIYRKLPC